MEGKEVLRSDRPSTRVKTNAKRKTLTSTLSKLHKRSVWAWALSWRWGTAVGRSGMDRLYEISVPGGVSEGQAFQVMIDGALMSVTCPPGVGPGHVIQVQPSPE
eukprot:scaffold153242_cov35-Tisochrysis_lutea.AAC.2